MNTLFLASNVRKSNFEHSSTHHHCFVKISLELDPFIGPVYSYTSVSEETLLQNIHEALQRESVTTEVLVGLLTLLCIILTTLVVYLCYTRGIASLSRYVM